MQWFGDDETSGRFGHESAIAEQDGTARQLIKAFFVTDNVQRAFLEGDKRASTTAALTKKAGLTLPNFGGLPNNAFQELGDGIIPMEPIMVAAKAAGVRHCHVEQDQSPDPLASIRQSMEYLKRL